MNEASFYKKFIIFLKYRKIIKSIKDKLRNEHNVRVDSAYRLYTVMNIPKGHYEEPYNLRTADINTLSEKYLRELSIKLSGILDEAGLMELYEVYNIEKIDKYSYLFVVGFSLFKTDKVFARILLRYLPITIVLATIGGLLYHFL